jgi:hypothetical protein
MPALALDTVRAQIQGLTIHGHRPLRIRVSEHVYVQLCKEGRLLGDWPPGVIIDSIDGVRIVIDHSLDEHG